MKEDVVIAAVVIPLVTILTFAIIECDRVGHFS